MDYQNVIYEKTDHIAKITLNRPDRMNALSSTLIKELIHLFYEIEHDTDAWVVTLTGGEKVFSVGADLKEKDRPADFLVSANTCFNQIDNLSKPTIAGINGHCLGGGCELAMCFDIRIASENAGIGLPEVKIGAIPAAGGTYRLPRLIGPSKAKEMLYIGDPITGEKAQDIGLVNRVVQDGQVEKDVEKLARFLVTERPPLALKTVKTCVQAGLQLELNPATDYMLKCVDILNKSEDHDEGVKAFIEKRKPQWKGK